jgi:glycerophosphoryl diester phosphodiesterase
LIVLFLSSCKASDPNKIVERSFPEFFKEGHRGARGLKPENTIASMKQAIDDGANFIELDIQFSKDNQVLVTHDPTINKEITLLPDSSEIPDSSEHVLHQMDYRDIRKFDVGSKHNVKFPDQQNEKAYIPLLSELIDSVEQYSVLKNIPPVIYNIEIKANPEKDGFYQPVPKDLVQMVMKVIHEKDLGPERYQIQSFDVRQIQEVHKNYPYVVTGFLTGNKKNSLEENLKIIGFVPQVYSPNFQMATPELIKKAHSYGMKFVPWTVNKLEDMKRLKSWGVDGIITDYPHLLNNLE